MANMQVTVVDGNNVTVSLDRGVAGVGIASISLVVINNANYLLITYTNGTTQTVGPVGVIQYSGTSPININGSVISLTTVPVNLGGTGQTTAVAGLNALLPAQTSQANKYLQTDGTNASWDAVSLSTADITGILPVANGGTGVSTSTGTGNTVLSTSPTLVTPALGTPASGVMTNVTGTAAGLTAGNVTTNANLTGMVTSVGNATTVVTNANLTGDITSIGNATAIAAGVIVNADINASAAIDDTKLATIATALKVSNSATTAASANTASAIVARDASGNFSAGTVTAALTGNASTATTLATGRTIAITGDLSYTSPSFDGSANVTAAGTLATVATAGVTGSSTAIPVVTINAKGLTTSITTAAVIAPASTLSGSTLAAGVTGSSLTSLGTIANLSVTAGTISTIPSSSTDIANKDYVDTVAQGLDPKASCVAATTANITLSGTQTIDGIALIAADRCLVKDQTAPAENGIYVVASGAWARSTDMNAWLEVPGAFTFIEQGNTQADTGWVCTSNAGGTLGTTAITFVQFAGVGSYTASTGLTLTGTAFSLTAPVTVALGGTNATSAGITSFNNITGYTAAGATGTTSTNLVFSTSPTLVTPILGTPQSATLTNATGLPISTGVSGLGTGIATALAVNVGTAGAPVVNGGALGTPSSGTVTNLTGTASININGTVGATTANTGAFTTLSSTLGANFATSSGSVGVGTASPQALLHVGAVAEAPGFGTTSQMCYVNGTSQPEVLIRETTNDVVVSMYADSTSGSIRTATNHPLVFFTNNTERARINAAGGLAVTGTLSATDTATFNKGATAIDLTPVSTAASARTNISWTAKNASSANRTTYIGSNIFLADGSTEISGEFAVNLMIDGVTKTALTSTGLAVTGTLSATNLISSTFDGAGNPWLSRTGATTNAQFIAQGNTGGVVYAGIETAAGGTLITGATGYSFVFRSPSTPIQFSANGGTSPQMTLDSSGNLLVGATSAYLSTFSGITAEGKTSGVGNNLSLGLSKAGTPQILNGDVLGNIYFYGVDNDVSGGNNNIGARIASIATTDWTTDGTTSNAALVFYTHGTISGAPPERARIGSNGYSKFSNVGTYNNTAGNYHEFRGDTSNSYVVVTACTNATPLSEYIQDFRFSAATPNDGNARFWNCEDATANRAYMLSNGGLANYAANNVILSDRREKTNFAPATSYLDKICAIPVQTFNYIDQNMEEDGGLTLGVVAQDVQAVAPELVTEGNWGSKEEPKMRLEIYQTDLQYALMKCIQEQQAIITQLTARITALETA